MGFESIESNRKDAQRDDQYWDVSNRLSHTESEYSEATNDLAAANRALKPKTLQERLIDCLNSIDPQIVKSLATSHQKIDCHGTLSESAYEQITHLAGESGASKYISKITWGGSGIGTSGMTVDASFEVFPALLQ